jgi:hypothetical protein
MCIFRSALLVVGDGGDVTLNNFNVIATGNSIPLFSTTSGIAVLKLLNIAVTVLLFLIFHFIYVDGMLLLM